jgi:citrate lyase gamma subunit
MKCPVHSKTVTVIETLSETGPSLKVSDICCEQFGQTIRAILKTNLQQDIIKQERTKVKDIFTDIFRT